MKATIKIDMDNAAFEMPGTELARILRDLAKRVEYAFDSFENEYDSTLIARDINGNTVGALKVKR